jgi:hypothetical protein
MKSHDYHIWIERLLPVIVRGYVLEHVWLVLAELSYFFRQLCAKELSRTVVADLEKIAPVVLCKLEKIFPPGFFNPMEHMILHLPYEARMGGGVQGRWCYPIERSLKVLGRNVEINVKSRPPLQRHTFWRRCRTSQQHTMVTASLVCTIHPHVTMLVKMNRTSAFS